jgi:hypothetical protein
VTNIGDNAFYCSFNLEEIHFKHTTPVTFSDEAFDYIDVSSVTIYVPQGSIRAYRNSAYYNCFKIEEEKE